MDLVHFTKTNTASSTTKYARRKPDILLKDVSSRIVVRWGFVRQRTLQGMWNVHLPIRQNYQDGVGELLQLRRIQSEKW